MNLLADENIEPSLIAWLRGGGHDVLSIREECRGMSDEAVLMQAHETGRILLTADKDFGELAFRKGHGAGGIVLLRIHTPSRGHYLRCVQENLPAALQAARGHFVTLTNRTLEAIPKPV